MIVFCLCLSCLGFSLSVLFVCFVKTVFWWIGSDIFSLIGICLEIAGAHYGVWLLLREHSVCCDSSEALQNGDPNLDQQNVPILLLYGLCFWLFRGILSVQAVQRKMLK